MGVEAAVAVAVIGATASHLEQKQAAKAEKKGRKIARGGEAAAEAQNLRQQVRKERIKRSQIIAAAESSGVSGASSESGSLSAMKSSLGSNIAFSAGQTEVADATSRQFQSAADHKTRAGNISAFSDVTSSGITAFN